MPCCDPAAPFRMGRESLCAYAVPIGIDATQPVNPMGLEFALTKGNAVMKKSILLMSIVALFASTVRAHDTALPNVTVYGTATTEVTPDQMKWYLTITNKGAALSRVADEHNRITSTVLALLRKEFVKEDHIQTARMEFGENWEYRNNNRVKEGYFASTSVAFELDDFDKYKSLWSGLATIQQVSIDGVSYDHSKRIDYRNETRLKALLDAKGKSGRHGPDTGL